MRKLLQLPSARHLRRIKNVVPQRRGIVPGNFELMYLQAQETGLSEKGRRGCLVTDEVQIDVRRDSCFMIDFEKNAHRVV